MSTRPNNLREVLANSGDSAHHFGGRHISKGTFVPLCLCALECALECAFGVGDRS